MNPTTAQRKATRTVGDKEGRPLGAIAHIIDGDALTPIARKILAATRPELSPMLIDTVNVEKREQYLIAIEDNRPAVVNDEGVGCFATEGTIGMWVCAAFERILIDVPTDDVVAATTDETIDLADGIRMFGARLDSNHFQWYTTYTGTYQP